jgi:hypothetical protein
MSDQPSPEEINRWNRWFAVECNNRAWELSSKPERSPADDNEMVYAAFAAAFHWSKAGRPVNNGRADVTLAHMLSLVEQGNAALFYARRGLEFFEANPVTDWDIAFAHAEMAFAAAVCGDADLHASHYARARQLGEAIAEEEDRKIFLGEFAKLPASALRRP